MTDVDKTVRVEFENGADRKADAHAGRGHGAASVLEALILAELDMRCISNLLLRHMKLIPAGREYGAVWFQAFPSSPVTKDVNGFTLVIIIVFYHFIHLFVYDQMDVLQGQNTSISKICQHFFRRSEYERKLRRMR